MYLKETLRIISIRRNASKCWNGAFHSHSDRQYLLLLGEIIRFSIISPDLSVSVKCDGTKNRT